MNKHVERMKTALNGYYNALKATDEKIRRNNETYQPAAAQAENQRLQTAIEQARRNAEAEIRSAENRKGAYQNFGKSALDLISAMHARPGFGTGLQSDTLKHSVETFGESATPNTAAIADLL